MRKERPGEEAAHVAVAHPKPADGLRHGGDLGGAHVLWEREYVVIEAHERQRARRRLSRRRLLHRRRPAASALGRRLAAACRLIAQELLLFCREQVVEDDDRIGAAAVEVRVEVAYLPRRGEGGVQRGRRREAVAQGEAAHRTAQIEHFRLVGTAQVDEHSRGFGGRCQPAVGAVDRRITGAVALHPFVATDTVHPYYHSRSWWGLPRGAVLGIPQGTLAQS